MFAKPTIVGVDDDPTARAFIYETLSTSAFNVIVTASCQEFYKVAGSVAANLYLVDVELPDGDGFGLTAKLRRRCLTPIIFLTVRGDDPDRLRGLELGAVEYLTKPINPREFLLRINNILTSLIPAGGLPSAVPANAGLPPESGTARRFGGLTFDLVRRCLVNRDGDVAQLTASEFDVLALLSGKPEAVISREEIARHLGPQSAARHNIRIVDVLVWRLRKKLSQQSPGSRFIATVPSRGYVFVEPVVPG
jgi:DNA-binding response OmpR family regulator